MSSNDTKPKKKKKGRKQAYQNEVKFYHNPHSKKTQKILNINHVGLCRRCEQIVEWRKTYRKYKPLHQPRRCDECHEKSVVRAYHTMCNGCALDKGVCPKCKQSCENVNDLGVVTEGYAMRRLEHAVIKEREKRTIMRYYDRGYLSPEKMVDVMETMERGAVVDWEQIRKEAEEEMDEDEEGEGLSDDDDDDEEGEEPKHGHVHKKASSKSTAHDFDDSEFDDMFDEGEDEDFYDYDYDGENEEELEAHAWEEISKKNTPVSKQTRNAKAESKSDEPSEEIVAGVPVEALAVPVEELRVVKPKDKSAEAQKVALNDMLSQLGPEGVAAALRAMRLDNTLKTGSKGSSNVAPKEQKPKGKSRR